MLIGYARCSTDAQDLTAQREALTALGVQPDRIYVDHGLTGTNRARPAARRRTEEDGSDARRVSSHHFVDETKQRGCVRRHLIDLRSARDPDPLRC